MLANTTKVKEECTVDDVREWLQTHHYPLAALELYYEMKQRYGETGTYTPLLAFATHTAHIASQNLEQEEFKERQEQKNWERKNEMEEKKLVSSKKNQAMNMLKSELVQCLRLLHAQDGVNGIRELLKEADIAEPSLTVEESKNVKYVEETSSESIQPLLQSNETMTEVCALRTEKNELAQELHQVKSNLHSCTSQLMESLPSLVNAIDITRRELLLPLYRLTALYSSTSSERVLARRQLLHLHKHPTAEVRKIIVKEWLTLMSFTSASSLSRETTWLQLEREILPELFHLGNSRLVEQRLLALECVCGLSTQLKSVLNSSNNVLREEHSHEQLNNIRVIPAINTNLLQNRDSTFHSYTLESVEAVERVYGLLYHGLLRPLCDDTSALVREQVVMCIASLWPSSQTTITEYTKNMCNSDNIPGSKTDQSMKSRKHVVLAETLPRMMEMIIELSLDAASGTVRHVAQSQLRSVIFIKSFHSHVLLTSFVPLLFVFVEKELRELLEVTTSSSSMLSLSESPLSLATMNYNTENVAKPHSASISNTINAVVTADQNAQSVFAHTRPSTLRSMLKGNVYTLIRLIHDALHCAVAQTIHSCKQRLVKVEECNNTCSVSDGKNMAHASSGEQHAEHKLLEENESEEFKIKSETIAKRTHEVNNNNDEDECKANLIRHEVNQVYTSVVLPLFTQMMKNISAMATGNKLQQEKEENTCIDVVCKLSYTMALFCKLFDCYTWLEVKKHLLFIVQSESISQTDVDAFPPDIKVDNSSNFNTVKTTKEKSHFMLLRMLFAFLLRVVSEGTLVNNEENMESCKMEEINSMTELRGELNQTSKNESMQEFICCISENSTVCLVHIIASGVTPKYTSDECFNVAAEVIAQFASIAKHDVKITRAIKRILQVMYNFVLYKDECETEWNANGLKRNHNYDDDVKNNCSNTEETIDDLANYIESCQLWCIVFIVKVCELLDMEDEQITSTLFCAFLHHLIDKTTDENDHSESDDNISVKVKEEVICALVQTVLPLNDVNEQLALLTPALEMLKMYNVMAHIYERVLHIMFTLISRGIAAEAREIIIYPFLEMIINKLSESSLSYAEMSSTVNELMQVLEAILRCAVVTPSLVNEHLLKPMIEFTTHKLKTISNTENTNTSTTMTTTSAKPSVSSTRVISVRSSNDKWLDLLLRYQGFVERNRENSFVSHFVSSPLLIRMKDELRKRLERM